MQCIQIKYLFVQDITNYEQRKQYVISIVNSIGEELVNNLIQASVFSLQTYMLPDVIDVIIELMTYNKDVRLFNFLNSYIIIYYIIFKANIKLVKWSSRKIA